VKKVKSPGRKAAGRSAPAKTVDDYLASVPEPARSTLEKVRAAIRSVVPPGTVEVISYGVPAFKHKRVLVWYAAFSDHCSLLPTASVIEAFRSDLKSYSISKGTIHFPTGKPLPGTLVKKMVKLRLAESGSKTAAK
jgi:uncharacterized protein YdhG (YjbR/CyaY superfamily)